MSDLECRKNPVRDKKKMIIVSNEKAETHKHMHVYMKLYICRHIYAYICKNVHIFCI